MTNNDDHITYGGVLAWAKKSGGAKGTDSSFKYCYVWQCCI